MTHHIAGPSASRKSSVIPFRRAAKLEAGRRKLDAGVAYLEALASSGVSIPPEELLVWSDTIEWLRHEVIADRSVIRFAELEAYRKGRGEPAMPGMLMMNVSVHDAVERTLNELRGCQPGSQDDTMNTVALKLCGLIKGNPELYESAVKASFLEACRNLLNGKSDKGSWKPAHWEEKWRNAMRDAKPRKWVNGAEENDEADGKRDYGLKILSEARPLAGTIGERYFRETRGVDPSSAMEAMFFHPAVSCSELGKGRTMAAVVTPIRRAPGTEPIAVHVTYVAPDGAKPDLEVRKRTFGKGIAGCALYLMPVGPKTLVVEGIEKALKVHSATGLPVIPAGTKSLLAGMEVQPEIEGLVICGDRGAEKETKKLARRTHAEGKKAYICYPPIEGKDWDECPDDAVRETIKNAPLWEPDSGGKAGKDSADEILKSVEAINTDHAFIMSRGGRACVLHEGFDEEGAPKEFYYGINDFHNILLNRGGLIVGEKEKFVEKSKLWMRHPQRRQHQSVIFDPSTTDRSVRNHYNLWHGFGVEPIRGSWSLMRQHILNILAAGDEEMDEYIYNWYAWAVQNPEKQAEAALVSRGPRGSGKGVAARLFARMFGRHGLHVSSSALLTGRFSAHLEKCAGLFADEAFHAGDKQAESQLKRIITEPTLIIEGKGKDAFQAPNRLKIIMASNEDWVAPVGARERRFAIGDVSHARLGDKAYFTALFHEMADDGGLSAMLYDLLDADIAGFHPRWSIPQTGALKEQALHSLPPELKWLLSLLEDGKLPYREDKHKNRTSLDSLLEHARKAIDRKKAVQDMDLIQVLKKWGVKAKHTKTGNFWVFPPLANMRARFDSEYGKQDWPVSDEEERLRGELHFTEIKPPEWG